MPPIGGFDAGFSGGGASLGNAHGSITLDTADLLRAEQISRTVGRNIEQNLAGVGQAADVVERKFGGLGGALTRGLSSVQGTIQSLRGELLAIGAGGSLITGFGLKAASDIRTARIRLGQFVQTEEEANELMNELADNANRFGLEIDQVTSFASTLLPIINGNVEAVDEWVTRAARLRTVFPQAVRGSELRAISEYLSGNAVSLQRLFNISQSIIQEAKSASSDLGEQLDYILDRMGATEEASLAIADPWVGVRNELKLIAAEGFTPILLRLREILPEVRTWLSDLRQARPEIFEIGAGLAVAAATGAPLLLLFGQILSTLQKIKALGILGPLGKAGLIGGAAIGGTLLATEGLQAVGRATGDERLATITPITMLKEALKAVLDLFFIFAAALAVAQQTVVGELVEFAAAIASIYTGLGNLIGRIGDILPDELGGDKLREAGNSIAEAGEGATEFIRGLREANDDFLSDAIGRHERLRAALLEILDRAFPTADTTSDGPALGGSVGIGAGGLTELEEARIAAIEEYQEATLQLESRYHDQRLALTEQHESQRARIIGQYELTILREAEDFGRQRARAQRELNSQIETIRAESAANEAEWWQDLQESIAEIQQEGNDRIAEIEADAQRTREQMERQHRDNLLSAASRLDARAVSEEQRRFATQSTNFEQDLQVRLDKERENINDRIQQEQEGHERRIQEQRQADEERIAAMIQAQEERFAVEDEERKIRLARMEEDHKRQLAELDKAARDRQQKLKEQYRDELTQLEDEFVKRNRALTAFYGIWETTQQTQQQASLDAWDDFWQQWLQSQSGALGGTQTGGTGTGTGGTGTGTGGGGETPPSRQELEQIGMGLMVTAGWSQETIFAFMRAWRDWTDRALAIWIETAFGYDVPGYATGTNFVPRTGLAMMHQGEIVIDPITSGVLRGRYGNNVARHLAYNSSSKSSRLNIGSINIQQQPGESADAIASAVMRRLTTEFEAMA